MILVTGATGFLGRFIVDELLTSGYEVRVLVRNADARQLPWGTLVEVADGDVLDITSLERALKGVKQVIHAAAVVSFWKDRRDEILKINIEGTANLVDACLDAQIEKFVQVSSVAAVGRTGTQEPIREHTKWVNSKAMSWYARSKYKAELEVYRGIAEGLNAAFVNPGLILGPGQNWQAGPPKIFTIVHRGMRFFNRGLTGMVGAEDVARATRIVLEQDVPLGERYLLISENWSQQKLINEIAQHFGKKPASWQLPPFVSLFVGRISELIASVTGREPVITLASMRNSIHRNYFDGSKITGLGFSYQPLKEVVAETAQAFLKAHSK